MQELELDLAVQELEGLDVPGFWEAALGVAVGVGLGLLAIGIT